ncbi:hypothetical protein HW132_27720 [Brasilonema sp. CT11]|nr:hypothetical protein [Brasilonema sp. CT11]
MTNDWRNQLDAQLKDLVLLARRHPHKTKERRIALTRLINAIWQSRRLCRPYSGQFQLLYQDIYDEAVQSLFFYLCQDDNINKYDPERAEVMTWVNMLLTKRFFPQAIPKTIGKENEITLEKSHIENISSSENISLYEQVIQYIEDDPEEIFMNEHIKGHPEANFQAIVIKRDSGVSWKNISTEWGNSCDGLGLARELQDLQIPQIIVMREPVPDLVAQKFLEYFLEAFSSGASLYTAVRSARERLEGLENEYPGASWLPVICEHPGVVPMTWAKPQTKSNSRRLPIMLLVSMLITAGVLGVRYLGGLQTWELQAFDQLMR